MTVDELITKLHKLIDENPKVSDALVIVGSSDDDNTFKAEEVCYDWWHKNAPSIFDESENVVLIMGEEGY